MNLVLDVCDLDFKLGSEIYTTRKNAELVFNQDCQVVGHQVTTKVIGPLTVTHITIDVNSDGTSYACFTDPPWGVILADDVCMTKEEAEGKVDGCSERS